MPTEIADRLQAVFRKVFNCTDLNVRPETTVGDVPGWDSLKHVELIISIESTFGVKFNTSEAAGVSDVGELINKLVQKLKP